MKHLIAIALATFFLVPDQQNQHQSPLLYPPKNPNLTVNLEKEGIKDQKATPTQIVQQLLEDPANIEHTRKFLADDFVYVSLNYKNEDLNKIMPWAGTHHGPDSFSKVFKGVYERWTVDEFTPEAAFDDGKHVAIFGSFTLRSKTLNRARRSPFAIYAKVNAAGKITYFQYMEDTFATADTFRTGGEWIFQPIPQKNITI